MEFQNTHVKKKKKKWTLQTTRQITHLTATLPNSCMVLFGIQTYTDTHCAWFHMYIHLTTSGVQLSCVPDYEHSRAKKKKLKKQK